MGLGEQRRAESGEACTLLTDPPRLSECLANGSVHFSLAVMEVTETSG